MEDVSENLLTASKWFRTIALPGEIAGPFINTALNIPWLLVHRLKWATHDSPDLAYRITYRLTQE